jgi:hypothetical protein
MNQKTKICGHCRTAKSIDEFYNNKGKKDGKSGYCKVCDKDMMHKRFAKSGKYKDIFKIWKQSEKEYLRMHYATAEMKDMVAFLGATPQQIRQMAIYVGMGGKRRENILEKARAAPKKKRVYKTRLPKLKAKTLVQKPAKIIAVKIVRGYKTPARKYDKAEKTYHRELPRFVEKKFATKEVNASELLPFKIDKKTTLYLPVNMPDEKRLEIITKYQSRKRA